MARIHEIMEGVMFKQALCKQFCLLYLMFHGNEYYVPLATFPLPGIINSKPIDEYRVYGIKIKVLLTGIFNQTFCEVPLLPECNYGIEILKFQ